jgi:hypothetical protein
MSGGPDPQPAVDLLELPPHLALAVERYAARHGLDLATAYRCLIAAGLQAEAENLRSLRRRRATEAGGA